MAATINIRPSRADRWVNCHGSALLESNFESVKSESAIEGDAAHEIVAACMNGKLPEEFVDRQTENGTYVSPEMAEYVQDHLNNLLKIAPLNKWIVEQKIHIPFVHTSQTGTPDAYYYDHTENVLTVADFKYGWGIVEAFENWQLLNYAVGIIAANSEFTNVKRIDLLVSQPRPHHHEGRCRIWSIDNALSSYADKLKQAALIAHGPNPPIVAGKHCRDCLALRQCPAARLSALSAIHISDIAILEEYEPDVIGAEIELLESAFKAIENRLKAVKTMAEERLKKGQLVTGYSVERAYGNRKWKKTITPDQIEAIGKMLKKELVTKKPLTPKQALTAGLPENMLEIYTTIPETGLKLIRNSAIKKAERAFS